MGCITKRKVACEVMTRSPNRDWDVLKCGEAWSAGATNANNFYNHNNTRVKYNTGDLCCFVFIQSSTNIHININTFLRT